MTTVTSYQRFEFEGKTYDISWYGDRATVRVHTKKGPRTLNGRGKANRWELASRVIAAAKEAKND
jgi:hypothetical protein